MVNDPLVRFLGVGTGHALAGQDQALAINQFADADGLVTRVISAPGDDTRLFIATREGRVQILNWKTGEFNDEPFLDLSSIVNSGAGEAAIGIARLDGI